MAGKMPASGPSQLRTTSPWLNRPPSGPRRQLLPDPSHLSLASWDNFPFPKTCFPLNLIACVGKHSAVFPAQVRLPFVEPKCPVLGRYCLEL